MKKILPLIIFLLVIGLLWRGLSLHPSQIPSPFINKPTPDFQLPELFDPEKKITQDNLKGRVTLLNVWATWCFACGEEHAFLVQLAKEQHIIFYGLNYKDDPNDAKNWLKKNGNPYQEIAVDNEGDTAINFGVYGAPETFIIDKKGIIRYKQIGPITPDIWESDLKPLVEKLQSETP